MYPYTDRRDEELIDWCREVARICISEEFKRLHREILKLYRKSGVRDPQYVAFQDTLFSFFLETDTQPHSSYDSYN